MSTFVLCDHDQAGGFLIQTMDKPRSLFTANAFHLGVVPEHGIDQCSTRVTGRGMNDHPGRFIDHQQVIILEQNIQRNIFCNKVNGRGRWDSYCDRESIFQFLPRLAGSLTVHVHQARPDESLNA
jgi:hypothetical protein